ncbi:hypothetical protein ACOSQ4_032184 [Xanthoceras sorbifolium]
MMLEESFQENIYKGENSAVLLTEGVSLFSVNVPYIDPVVASVTLVENERDFRPKVIMVMALQVIMVMAGHVQNCPLLFFMMEEACTSGIVNPRGIILDGSSLGKIVQDTLSDDLPTGGDVKQIIFEKLL